MKNLYFLLFLVLFSETCYGIDTTCNNLSDYKRCPSGVICKPDLLDKKQFCKDAEQNKELGKLILRGESCEDAFDRLYGSFVRENEMGLCKNLKNNN